MFKKGDLVYILAGSHKLKPDTLGEVYAFTPMGTHICVSGASLEEGLKIQQFIHRDFVRIPSENDLKRLEFKKEGSESC